MDKYTNDANNDDDHNDSDATYHYHRSHSLFAVNPPLVDRIAIDGTDTGDCRPSRHAAFVLLVAFLLTHYFYYTK